MPQFERPLGIWSETLGTHRPAARSRRPLFCQHRHCIVRLLSFVRPCPLGRLRTTSSTHALAHACSRAHATASTHIDNRDAHIHGRAHSLTRERSVRGHRCMSSVETHAGARVHETSPACSTPHSGSRTCSQWHTRMDTRKRGAGTRTCSRARERLAAHALQTAAAGSTLGPTAA